MDNGASERELVVKLKQEIAVLQGLIPLCPLCKRIREDEEYWREVELYVKDHPELQDTGRHCTTCQAVHGE